VTVRVATAAPLCCAAQGFPGCWSPSWPG